MGKAGTEEMQRYVDAIADVLELPVSLTDTDLNSLLFSPHSSEIDDVRRDSLLLRRTAPWVRDWFADYGVGRSAKPVRVEPHPARETMSRVVIPVRHRGLPLGYLCALDPERVWTEAAQTRVIHLIAELAELMYDDQADRLQVSRLLDDLLRGNADTRRAAADELEQLAGLTRDDPCVIVAATGVRGARADDHPQTPPPSTPSAAPPILQTIAADHHVFLLRPDRPSDGTPKDGALQLRLVEHGVSRCCGRRAVLGVGEPVVVDEAASSYRQARSALSAGARVRGLHSPVHFSELGALRMVATRSDAELEAALDPELRTFLRGCDQDLRKTLSTYLATGCDAAASSAELNVHRGTLYYRLRKIESLTHKDLGDGFDRLTLHLSLLTFEYLSSTSRPAHEGPVHLLQV